MLTRFILNGTRKALFPTITRSGEEPHLKGVDWHESARGEVILLRGGSSTLCSLKKYRTVFWKRRDKNASTRPALITGPLFARGAGMPTRRSSTIPRRNALR